MNEDLSDAVRHQRVLVEFSRRQAALVKRRAQVMKARFGAAWLWVALAAVVWLEVAAGWLVDLSSVTGRIVLFAPIVLLCVLGLAMMRSIERAREELFLAIIEQDAAESYRRLKEDGVVR